MIDQLKQDLQADPTNPFLQGHVGALEACEKQASEMITMPRKVQEQAIRMAELRGVPTWTDATLWLPPDARCVLATDMEAHFIACYENGEWCNAWTEEVIDSVITNWMELPELPEQ